MTSEVAVRAALDALRELGEAQVALRKARGAEAMSAVDEQVARALAMARAVTQALVASGRGL